MSIRENRSVSVKLFTRTISFLALASILGAGAFAIAGPQTKELQAKTMSADQTCASREVSLDEGYGVSRVEVREVCGR